MDIIGIYTIMNLVTHKFYMGSSIRCRARIGRHIRALTSQKHDNKYLQNAWNKHGPDAFIFVVIEECKAEDRFVREQYWIDRFETSNSEKGFNLAHSVKTIVPSPHTSKRMREMWTDDMRAAQAENSNRQYKDPKIKAIRLKSLDSGREKVNAKWYDPESKVRAVRQANLAKGSEALQILMKDPVWCKSRKTGSRTKELWLNPDYRDRQLEVLKSAREKAAVVVQDKWDNDPKYRDKILTALRKSNEDPDFKARHAAKLKGFWDDPEYRARHSARVKARWAKYRAEKAKNEIV